MKKKLIKALKFLDEHLIIIVVSFLIAFIPLYPKIPLADLLPGYIVRLRLEDVFIFIALILWLIQVIRKKVKWKSAFSWLILAYVIFTFISIFSATFITQTIVFNKYHIAKSLLHWLRYIEYFLLFFFGFSAVKTKKDLKIAISVMSITLVAIIIYGIGQKYLYWPVYSTMNREFAKGMRLVLTKHARVQSTFAGHYDLAAYLVITLLLFLSLALSNLQKTVKLLFHLLHLLGLWLLMMSASRSSHGAYLLGSAVIVTLFTITKKTKLDRSKYFISRAIFLVILNLIMIDNFGKDLAERYIQILRGYPQAYEAYEQFTQGKEDLIEKTKIALHLKDIKIEKPEDAITIDDALADNSLVKSDERPVPADQKSDQSRPVDVYEDIPDVVEVATQSASGSTEIITIEKPRVFSDCSMLHSLSYCIRVETLWPNAIQGFYTNPLLGKGYATLNKKTHYEFTIAESTDNNFLRILGETGLLGFSTFFGIIIIAMIVSSKFIKDQDKFTQAISIGYISLSIGLLGNAIYIDVYAASKVAFTYWTITGLLVGYYLSKPNKNKTNKIGIIKFIDNKTNQLLKQFNLVK